MTPPLRIGIVGCGRILPAHLRGFRLLRESGRDDFQVTALVARRAQDALMFRKRGEGPAPRPPVSLNPDDALGAPHVYVSDFQPEREPDIYTDVADMLAAERCRRRFIDGLGRRASHDRVACAGRRQASDG